MKGGSLLKPHPNVFVVKVEKKPNMNYETDQSESDQDDDFDESDEEINEVDLSGQDKTVTVFRKSTNTETLLKDHGEKGYVRNESESDHSPEEEVDKPSNRNTAKGRKTVKKRSPTKDYKQQLSESDDSNAEESDGDEIDDIQNKVDDIITTLSDGEKEPSPKKRVQSRGTKRKVSESDDDTEEEEEESTTKKRGNGGKVVNGRPAQKRGRQKEESDISDEEEPQSAKKGMSQSKRSPVKRGRTSDYEEEESDQEEEKSAKRRGQRKGAKKKGQDSEDEEDEVEETTPKKRRTGKKIVNGRSSQKGGRQKEESNISDEEEEPQSAKRGMGQSKRSPVKRGRNSQRSDNSDYEEEREHRRPQRNRSQLLYKEEEDDTDDEEYIQRAKVQGKKNKAKKTPKRGGVKYYTESSGSEVEEDSDHELSEVKVSNKRGRPKKGGSKRKDSSEDEYVEKRGKPKRGSKYVKEDESEEETTRGRKNRRPMKSPRKRSLKKTRQLSPAKKIREHTVVMYKEDLEAKRRKHRRKTDAINYEVDSSTDTEDTSVDRTHIRRNIDTTTKYKFEDLPNEDDSGKSSDEQQISEVIEKIEEKIKDDDFVIEQPSKLKKIPWRDRQKRERDARRSSRNVSTVNYQCDQVSSEDENYIRQTKGLQPIWKKRTSRKRKSKGKLESSDEEDDYDEDDEEMFEKKLEKMSKTTPRLKNKMKEEAEAKLRAQAKKKNYYEDSESELDDEPHVCLGPKMTPEFLRDINDVYLSPEELRMQKLVSGALAENSEDEDGGGDAKRKDQRKASSKNSRSTSKEALTYKKDRSLIQQEELEEEMKLQQLAQPLVPSRGRKGKNARQESSKTTISDVWKAVTKPVRRMFKQ